MFFYSYLEAIKKEALTIDIIDKPLSVYIPVVSSTKGVQSTLLDMVPGDTVDVLVTSGSVFERWSQDRGKVSY